jgi:uncharacterized damage-inducible protein DinB
MGIRESVQAGFPLIWNTVQKNVAAMPDAGMEFTPPGLETRSFRAIAVHMANATVTFGENIGKDVWERVAAYPMDKPMPKAQVLDALRDAGQRFLAGLVRLTDQEAARVVRTPWGMEVPQGILVPGAITHMFYHNGQLSIYLRMQGVTPLFLAR